MMSKIRAKKKKPKPEENIGLERDSPKKLAIPRHLQK